MIKEQIPFDLWNRWMNSLIEGVEESVNESAKLKILEKCGIACSHYHRHIEKIRDIKRRANSLDKIIDIMNQEEMWCGKWIKEGNTIYSECNKVCGCPLVASGMVKLSPTHCYCSHGYMKSVFGEILDKSFEVRLEKSIGRGDNVCLYTVKFNS
jgi:predicted hydrocarbon binding protein